MKKLVHQWFWPDVLIVFLLCFLLPFFFFNLGLSSLVSWDEAWYAEIARNIIKSGDIFNLTWNQMAYYDHPPVGFWLIAIGEILFGYSEFGVRFASAAIGFLSVVAMYFLGKIMFNRVVGFASAVGLASSFWFLFRSRSGNLDVFLTFFFILTFLTAWKARYNPKWMIWFGLSLVLVILTKTGIPFTIMPALMLVFWGRRYSWRDGIAAGSLLFFIGGIWLISQFLTNRSFFDRYLMIGLPGVGGQTSYLDNFLLAKAYVHDGIGRWFWPGVFGIVLSVCFGIYTIFKRKADRKWFIFPLFVVSFFGPFILSAKGHIWHLIPLHPFLILGFFSASYAVGKELVEWIGRRFVKRVKPSLYLNTVMAFGIVVFGLYIALFQLRSAWIQFIDQTKYVSDEQILSEEAGRQDAAFFLDDDFGPTAVWYSGGKRVSQLRGDDVKRLFNKQEQFGSVNKFTLITKQYRLDEQGIAKDQYQILKSDRDKILVISD
jgi:4-amino-4-deoxy-L-arabinose transferase-like glycosyltransferase